MRMARTRDGGFWGVLWLGALGLGVLVGLTGCGGGISPEEKRLNRDMAVIMPAIDMFTSDCGRPPTVEEGLIALVEKPAGSDIAAAWRGPYLQDRTVLKDQWGKDYVMLKIKTKDGGTSQGPWSTGVDGVPYTKDDVYDSEWFENGGLLPPSQGQPG